MVARIAPDAWVMLCPDLCNGRARDCTHPIRQTLAHRSGAPARGTGRPLEDQEANRRARQQGGDLAARIETRALWLAERDGMTHALRHWKQGARLALLALMVLAVLSGAGLGLAALGDGQRPVNVFWALGSLLGLNLLMLLGWAAGLLLAGEHDTGLGRLWLWLSERLARDAQAAHLAPALLVMLQRQRLNRWLLGALVHGLWLLAMVAAVGMLLALLATRRYGFVWETTLLAAEPFIHLTQTLGALPSLLGFAVPDEALIRASGDTLPALDLARQAWASWLLGVVLVYGLLPRLLLALLCLWHWHQGRARLKLDLNLPGYSHLREVLMPSSERLGVQDAAPHALPEFRAGQLGVQDGGALLVGLELDDQRPWPPILPKTVANAGVLDSRESRNKLLEQLSRFPPARLAIACDPVARLTVAASHCWPNWHVTQGPHASGCSRPSQASRWTPIAWVIGMTPCIASACPTPTPRP